MYYGENKDKMYSKYLLSTTLPIQCKKLEQEILIKNSMEHFQIKFELNFNSNSDSPTLFIFKRVKSKKESRFLFLYSIEIGNDVFVSNLITGMFFKQAKRFGVYRPRC